MLKLRAARNNRAFHLLVLATVLLLANAAAAAQVWIAPGSTKVRPLTPTPSPMPTSASIAAAKNEFESFHVVVTGPATGVSMAFEGLSDGQGNTISGHEVVLYREALIDILTQSGGDGATGWWPDALVPDVDPIAGEKRNAFPFNVPAGENRAVYVDVHVPDSVPAGTYTGTIVVSGGVSAQVPVTLTVWDFSVPSTSTLQSAWGLSWNGPCLGHGDGSCSNLSYEMPLRQRYVQALLDNHVSTYFPFAGNFPVGSNGSANWTLFDQYVGPFLDGSANTRLKGAKLTKMQIFGAGVIAGSGGASTAMVKGWSDHFKAKGWAGTLFNYLCDEPPATCAWSDIPTRAAASRAADPTIPTLVTTEYWLASANNVQSSIDIMVAPVNFMEDRPGTQFAGNQRPNWPAYIWMYQGCMSFGCGGGGATGWPSYAIDTDFTRNRALEWMDYSYDAYGELYYETTMAISSGLDPWVSQYNFGGNGDGTLILPGTPARIGGITEIPIETLRLKGIRDGMEDYELLHLADSLGLRTEAKAIAKAVYPAAYNGVTTPAAIDSARAQLAALILHALGRDTPPAGGGTDGGTGGTDGGTVGTGGTDGGTGGTGGGTGGTDGGTDGGTGGVVSGTGGGTGTGTGTTGSGPSQAGTNPPDTTGADSSPRRFGRGEPGSQVSGGAPLPTRTSSFGNGPGGCSSTGVQSVWMALAVIALFAARRRRRA